MKKTSSSSQFDPIFTVAIIPTLMKDINDKIELKFLAKNTTVALAKLDSLRRTFDYVFPQRYMISLHNSEGHDVELFVSNQLKLEF